MSIVLQTGGHCGIFPRCSGVATHDPLSTTGTARRFSPRHHFGQLSPVWKEQLRLCSERSPRAWAAVFVECQRRRQDPGAQSPLGTELEKVEQEVERYQSSLRLCQELVEVNNQICQRRPVRAFGTAPFGFAGDDR